MQTMLRAMHNPEEAGAAAVDYLRLCGLIATGWMWLKMARIAQGKLAAATANGDASFYDTKVKTARFYFARIFPQTLALVASINSGAAPVMELAAAEF